MQIFIVIFNPWRSQTAGAVSELILIVCYPSDHTDLKFLCMTATLFCWLYDGFKCWQSCVNLQCNPIIITWLLVIGLITMDYISSFCTYIMGELIRHQPCNELSHHFSLIIYSLDGDENLSGKDKCFVNCRTEDNELKSYKYNPYFVYMSNKKKKKSDGCTGTFLRARAVIT